MKNFVNETIKREQEELKAYTEKKKILLENLAKYDTLTLAEKIAVIKEFFRGNYEFIGDFIKTELKSQILKDGHLEGCINEINVFHKGFHFKINLAVGNIITISSNCNYIGGCPEYNPHIRYEDMFLTYFAYHHNKTFTNFKKHLETRYERCSTFRRYFLYLIHGHKKKADWFYTEFNKQLDEQEKRYNSQLDDYMKHKQEVDNFLNDIQADIEMFEQAGFKIVNKIDKR